jgi:hypothetical protein
LFSPLREQPTSSSKELRKQVFVTVFVLDANCNWQDQGDFLVVATHASKWMPFCAELGDEGFQGNQTLPLCLQFTCYVSNSVDILVVSSCVE